jgi:hypothetical protein
METLANLERALGEKGGEHSLTTETASLNDGDSVTFPGNVVFAWADSGDDTAVAMVTGTSGADVTVGVKAIADGSAGGAASVTVNAVHE